MPRTVTRRADRFPEAAPPLIVGHRRDPLQPIPQHGQPRQKVIENIDTGEARTTTGRGAALGSRRDSSLICVLLPHHDLLSAS